jgi:hypothetical protein
LSIRYKACGLIIEQNYTNEVKNGFNGLNMHEQMQFQSNNPPIPSSSYSSLGSSTTFLAACLGAYFLGASFC